jgi:hypothetical protein
MSGLGGFKGHQKITIILTCSVTSPKYWFHLSWSFTDFSAYNNGQGYIHGFRGPNARTRIASTDSVDRTPELSLRSRIPWTERQNSRCVHGFRGPNARSRPIVAFTDSVNRMPGVSCHCVHGFRELYSTRFMRIVTVTDSDAMKSRGGTCHVALSMEVLLIIPPCTIQCFIYRGRGGEVPIKLNFFTG